MEIYNCYIYKVGIYSDIYICTLSPFFDIIISRVIFIALNFKLFEHFEEGLH